MSVWSIGGRVLPIMVYPKGYLLLVYERAGTSLVNVQERVRETYDYSLRNDLRGVTKGHVKDKRTSQFHGVILVIYKRWSVYTPWSDIGRFQKISIPYHGRLPCFKPPLPSEIPKCVTPPCPQNSIIVNPPSPSEFPFFWGSTFST